MTALETLSEGDQLLERIKARPFFQSAAYCRGDLRDVEKGNNSEGGENQNRLKGKSGENQRLKVRTV